MRYFAEGGRVWSIHKEPPRHPSFRHLQLKPCIDPPAENDDRKVGPTSFWKCTALQLEENDARDVPALAALLKSLEVEPDHAMANAPHQTAISASSGLLVDGPIFTYRIERASTHNTAWAAKLTANVTQQSRAFALYPLLS